MAVLSLSHTEDLDNVLETVLSELIPEMPIKQRIVVSMQGELSRFFHCRFD